MVGTAFSAFAESRWPFDHAVLQGETHIVTYMPPSKDAAEVLCDPIRRQILEMDDKPFYIQWLYMPRMELLKNRHRKCLGVLREQERAYLEHIQPTPQPDPEETGMLPDMDMTLPVEIPPEVLPSPQENLTPLPAS